MSGFQHLLKQCCCLHQKFSHEESSVLAKPKQHAESPYGNYSHSRNSHWTRFIVL